MTFADAPAGTPARRAAAAVVAAVLEKGRPLDEALAAGDADGLEGRDRAFVRLLAATALRRLGEIDAILSERLSAPLADAHPRARTALRLGVAQLVHLRTPAHAAVSATVETLSGRSTDRLKGLVNAVLRRVARDAPAPLEGEAAARAATPPWLWDRLEAVHGAAGAVAIAAAHLAEPPLDLTLRGDGEGWAARLGGTLLPTGSLRLDQGGAVPALDGYAEGGWWVQDAAAALPARLLGDVAGRAVIDLGAAPGGKTAQLAAAGAAVTAVELSPRRGQLLADNLGRLGLSATIVTADATTWRPDRPADAVLLDAPCSATGTIRRHPDIPHLRGPDDVARLAALQDRMLDAAVAMVRPGGLLVFATCSLLPEEGEDRVAALLARGAPVAVDPIGPADVPGCPEAATADGLLRTLPSFWYDRGGMDGFFAARLRRLPGA
ncbi:MAG: RsmB/NOP family class I SAM-dependent RNA methyltransferase [Alphaproteobacteria bacterium]